MHTQEKCSDQSRAATPPANGGFGFSVGTTSSTGAGVVLSRSTPLDACPTTVLTNSTYNHTNRPAPLPEHVLTDMPWTLPYWPAGHAVDTPLTQ